MQTLERENSVKEVNMEENNKKELKGRGILDFEVEDEDKSKKGATTLEDEVNTKEVEPKGSGNLDFEVEDEAEAEVVSPVVEKDETYDTSGIEWD